VSALLVGLAGAAAAALAYGSLVERHWYALRRHRVPCLPEGSRPIRLLHLSDLHFRRSQRRKRAFVEGLAATRPDLLVCTGDFLDEPGAVAVTAEALASIRPGAPALFVLGSHDYYASRPSNPLRYLRGPAARRLPDERWRENPWRELVATLEARGWQLLLNREIAIELEGVGRVEVVGLDDPHLDRHDLSVARPRAGAGLRLAVVHSPDPAPELAALGYDLIVAGHTHGGQLRVPGLGALVTNSRIPRRMARGLHRLGGAWLHVSAGLGTSVYAPVRFSCRPEACLLDLVPREADAARAALARDAAARAASTRS
jgi:predicted MPP superfamily phosphohydrolase